MKYEKADVLRSPSLYMEHFIARINKDPEVYKWFISDGVVTSVHSLVSRILQLDCDGDQLNIVVDPTIVKVAERNIKEFDVIPLFYDPNKAPAELITKESIFNGLKRAHQFSNIGEISNMLTRLWNRDNPDRHAAALLTYLNNLRIDGAKTGAVNEYTNYPDVAKQINKATGGRSGLMPAWFANSKNGRRDKTTNVKKKRKWAKPNDSTMNRLCGMFDDIGNINMNWAEIEPFNWQMLLPSPCLYNRPEIVKEFCELDSIKVSIAIQNAEESPAEKELENNNYILDEHITYMLTEKFGSLETCYPFIVKHLFVGDNFGKSANKQRFWRVFGDIAIDVLRKNLANCRTCPDCGAKIPNWAESHNCPKNEQGFYICEDCGTRCVRTNSRQKLCPDCQEHRRHDQKKNYRDRNKNRKEREREFSSFWQYRFKKM